ncbi:hypothetical protein ACHAWF_015885 [Thalassiosira exigua]
MSASPEMRDFVADKTIDGSGMSPPGVADTEEAAVEPAVESPTEKLVSTPDASSRASPHTRRVGLLQCPNAETLGWGGESTSVVDEGEVFSSARSGNLSSQSPMAPEGISEKGNGFRSSNEELNAEMSYAAVSKGLPETKQKDDGQHMNKQEEVESFDNSMPSDDRKRRRILDSTHNVQSPIMDSSNGNYRSDGLSETEEPMKVVKDTADATTSETVANHRNKPHHLSVALEYEPADSDSVMRSQILTVTYVGDGASAIGSSSIVVGTISGRARLKVLSPKPKSVKSEDNPVAKQSSICIDVFGYRIGYHDDANCSENNDSIIINRPDWMNSLPLSVIIRSPNQREGESLRLQIQSFPVTPSNDGEGRCDTGGGGDCYYSVHPEETYQLSILPPAVLFPGNHTAAGSGACIILEEWKSSLDEIVDGMMDDTQKVNATTCGEPLPAHKWAQEKRDRILVCGAKGVGKSTLLRYATNRILSARSDVATSNGRDCPSSVAVLDLDCGQSELSPPGMLTLTVVSRPLLSDPPVHMVCGGSCDHYGRNQNEGEGLEHKSAYFFGDITSKADPDAYIEMTSQLIKQYIDLQEKQGWALPLVVNTDGWVKGLGYEILSAIIGAVHPGYVLQIMGNTKAKSFDLSFIGHPIDSYADDIDPQYQWVVRVIQAFDESLLPAIDDDNRSRRSMDSSSSTGPLLASASDHRVLRLCTYFLGGHQEMANLRSNILGEHESISFHKERGVHDPNHIIGSTLASMLPYAVPFHSVKLYPSLGLLDGTAEPELLWGVQGDLARNDTLDSLNGSIIGLCCEPSEFPNFNAGVGVPLLPCVGLGIIRSIDHIHKTFFVLTPTQPRLLQYVNAFVGGNMILPLECVYRGVHSDSFPFMSFGHSLINTSLGANVLHNRSHSKNNNK